MKFFTGNFILVCALAYYGGDVGATAAILYIAVVGAYRLSRQEGGA